jgi:hypothetical protein
VSNRIRRRVDGKRLPVTVRPTSRHSAAVCAPAAVPSRQITPSWVREHGRTSAFGPSILLRTRSLLCLRGDF